MKQLLVALVVVGVSLFSSRANACERGLIRSGLPEDGLLRAVGTVVRYSNVAQPTRAIASAPSLVVRIDTIISGTVTPAEAEVVPLTDSVSCSPWPTAQHVLDTVYPIGSSVAFFAPNPKSPSSPILAHNSVVHVPTDVSRTPDGDLDFEHAGNQWNFVEFEFARAVINLRRAERSEKFRRLMNLAHYDGFRDPRGRAWLQQLISESRLSASQRAAVLEVVRPY